MLVLDGVEMMDVRETARLAGRTPETVRRWIWSGRLTARRHGNKLLVTRQAVEDLIGGGTAPAVVTLTDWAASVAKQRRAGLLGETSPASSAADLVIGDRSHREAG